MNTRVAKWTAMLAAGGTLWAAGGCLADNFWATLLGDTIVTGTVSAVLAGALAAVGVGA